VEREGFFPAQEGNGGKAGRAKGATPKETYGKEGSEEEGCCSEEEGSDKEEFPS